MTNTTTTTDDRLRFTLTKTGHLWRVTDPHAFDGLDGSQADAARAAAMEISGVGVYGACLVAVGVTADVAYSRMDAASRAMHPTAGASDRCAGR